MKSFASDQGAADHSVHFREGTTNTQGPAVNNNFDFKSSIQQGFIYYETPAISQIVSSSQLTTLSSHTAVVNLKDSGVGSAQRNFACDTDANCDVKYSVAYTPQIHRIYPSTVYSGQDICFEVFTDAVTNSDRDGVNKLMIGDYNADIETYDEDNAARENNLAIIHTNVELLLVQKPCLAMMLSYTETLGFTTSLTLPNPLMELQSTQSELFQKVESVYPNTLNPVDGSIISISGEGFSSIASENYY